jgi:hypothetical protein
MSQPHTTDVMFMNSRARSLREHQDASNKNPNQIKKVFEHHLQTARVALDPQRQLVYAQEADRLLKSLMDLIAPQV